MHEPRRGPATSPAALLCDRDGTLVVDVPYNADPARVELMPGVAAALDEARAEGMLIGIVTNQSGVARGLIAEDQLRLVHERLAELAGPFDVVLWCPHDDEHGCRCRKPQPGMVLEAAARLGVDPSACVVVGDISADVIAAEQAGATGIFIGDDPSGADAAIRCDDLAGAVDLVLAWRAAGLTSSRGRS